MKAKICIAATMAFSNPLLAQGTTADDAFIPATQMAKSESTVSGWDQYLGGSIYGNLNESKDVVGKADGSSTTLGLRLDGDLDYRRNGNEWRNNLGLNTSYARTPILDEYVKSEDILKLTSIYLFHIPEVEWAGPFVRASADTAMFAGYDNQAEAQTYEIARQDGSIAQEDTDRLKLTDSFRPLKLKQSFGAFVQPLSESWLAFEVRSGMGFRQLIADGQLVITDDAATDVVEVNELGNYNKYGYEVGLELRGKTTNKLVSYQLSTDMLIPTYESDKATGDDRSPFEKRVVDIDAKVSFHLVEWASIDYLLKSTRDPSISDKTQQSQTIMFSMNHTITPRRKS